MNVRRVAVPRRPGPAGHAVGVLMLDMREAYVVGDPSHAATFDFPVLFDVVEDVTIARLERADPEPDDEIVLAARDMEARGVGAISSNCSLFLPWQRVVADAVSIPVSLSSLAQLPFVLDLIGADRAVGVISDGCGEPVLAALGVRDPERIATAGLAHRPAFARWLTEPEWVDIAAVGEEVLDAGRELVSQRPEIGALLVECSPMAVHSDTLRAELGLPVYDFGTLIRHLREGVGRSARR